MKELTILPKSGKYWPRDEVQRPRTTVSSATTRCEKSKLEVHFRFTTQDRLRRTPNNTGMQVTCHGGH